MAKKGTETKTSNHISAQPRLHQRAREIQSYGTVNHALPLELEEPVRLEMTEQLNQLLADTMTLCDLYKKSHSQVAGPTFYQLHCFSTSTLTNRWSWSTRSPNGFSFWAASACPWPPISRKPHKSNVRPVVAKKFPFSCRDCSMRTKSLFAQPESWRVGPPSLALMARMTWSSAKCCAEMSCRFGS